MKPLFILFFSLVQISMVAADTYEDYSTSVRTVDGTPSPSCDLVRFRIQEYARRELEADHIIEWYSPVAQTVEQRSALLEVFRRVPFFFDDRLYEHLIVTHDWRVDIVETEKYKMALKKTSGLYTSRFNHWNDPFNGFFPEGITVDVQPGRVTLKQRMTFERFCLEDTKIEVSLGAPGVEIHLQAENDLSLLEETF